MQTFAEWLEETRRIVDVEMREALDRHPMSQEELRATGDFVRAFLDAVDAP